VTNNWLNEVVNLLDDDDDGDDGLAGVREPISCLMLGGQMSQFIDKLK
jgi:hypothetical protein